MKLRPVPPGGRVRLRDRDAHAPDGLPPRPELEARTARLVDRLSELQTALYAERRRALLVVLQARDAGGKDGAIRRVFGPLNAIGTAVHAFDAPTEDELARDFLWRVHQVVPPKGTLAVFNRSHYEDVLAARVREIVPPRVWKPRFRQINDWERMLVESGTTIVKLFLHVSRDEQKARLLERLDDPSKNWKFRPEDLEDRALWDDYTTAYGDALSRCSTRWAPWYVVPADDKRARDYLVARTVVDALRRLRPAYPAADPDVLAWRDRIV